MADPNNNPHKATASVARNVLPKRLEEDLARDAANNKFKPPATMGMAGKSRMTVGDVMAHQVESAMYDEILGPALRRPPASSSASTNMTPKLEAALAANSARKAALLGNNANNANNIGGSGSSSPDITVSLLTRLTDCETELKATRKQLAEKLRRITELEDDNRELKALLVEPSEVYEELDFVRGQNHDLMTKLDHMEAFLKDYGLVWVGNSSNSSNSSSSPNTDSSSVCSPPTPSSLSYSAFSKKIQELNDVINSEPVQVVKEADGKITKLARPSEILEQIRVVFYSNGLMVRRGPFRDHASESFRKFTRDVMDGYFPSEFRDEYPDGVVFVLVDRHDTVYDSSSNNNDDVLSGQQFLQRLPKTVIKNGEIVDVRSSINSRLTGDATTAGAKQSSSTPPLPALAGAAADNKKKDQLVLESMGFRHCGEAHRKPVTVQLRWVDGSMILMKLDASDDIGTIRSMVNQHFEQVDHKYDHKDDSKSNHHGMPAFELRTVWPAKVVDDDCTLTEAGLVPNGTLHAIRKRV
jgi:hypothetical protein